MSASNEDVIAAMRLVCIAQEDPVERDKITRLLLDAAPATPDSNLGGVDLLVERLREERLKAMVAGD